MPQIFYIWDKLTLKDLPSSLREYLGADPD